MRVLIGIVIQIVAILFIAEATNLFYESSNLAIVSVSIGTALFTFGYFLLHDNKNNREI